MNLENVVKVETMCSTEIAKLTGKRHDNVLVDVENMLNDLEICLLTFQGTYLTCQGKKEKCYNLDKDLTLTLVSGYNVKLRNAIIKRWRELEECERIVKQQPMPGISAKEQIEIADIIATSLRVSEASRIKMFKTVCETNGVDAKFLPVYTEEGETKSLTQLLKEHGCKLSAKAVNIRLLGIGILEEKTRPSTKNGGKDKKYKRFTEKGLTWGKNLINVNAERGSQPHYYVENFPKLIELVEQY